MSKAFKDSCFDFVLEAMEPLTIYEKWYGRDEPPEEILHLRAGSLTLDYENGDLRYLKLNGQELIRRVYVAIRDVNWNTIPAEMTSLVINQSEDRFHIQFEALNRAELLRFRWHAFIDGYPDGTIEYEMRGLAESDFRYCRMGFCVLHPIEGIAGSPYQAQTPQGAVSGTLPVLVEPQRIVDGFEVPLFPACSGLSIAAPNGTKIITNFEGDLFEMEDQRNWTDGSFKTYCTPLSLGYPHQAHTGMVVSQKVIIKAETTRKSQPIEVLEKDGKIQFKMEKSTSQRLPKLGIGITSPEPGIAERAVNLLKKLQPDHLKVEIYFKDSDWENRLNRAIDAASRIGSPLELALFLVDDSERDLNQFSKVISNAPVARIIVFHESEAPLGTTSTKWMKIVRDRLKVSLPGVPFIGGTNGNFAELNRQRPDISVMDGISYTINPQVHATDERSLVEALEAQGATVMTARSYCGSLPISISSVTLKPPFNQAATEEVSPEDHNELPSSVDPRQMSLFSAAWTVGSINSLSAGGTDSITYYELLGWRGLIESENGNTLPAKFRSFPGMVFPVYYVFEFLAQAKGGYVWKMVADQRQAASGLWITAGDRLYIVVSNLQPDVNLVQLNPMPDGSFLLRRLTHDTMETASTDPQLFLNNSEIINAVNNQLELALQPFETAMMKLDQK